MIKNFQSGQIILILLLVITIGLGVGLSVIQRSISDVSTSTHIEESSRAFSAAEAGVEEIVARISQGETLPNSGTKVVDFADNNKSEAKVNIDNLIPGSNQIFELPQVSRGDIIQAWLANPADNTPLPSAYYDQSGADIYWGNISSSSTDHPAVEIAVIYSQGGAMGRKSYYFDPDSVRATTNGFSPPGGNFSGCPNFTVSTNFGSARQFACKATLSGLGTSPPPAGLGLGRVLMLIRVKLFYTNTAHPIAFGPQGSCGGIACSFPPQAQLITSIGTSGVTQRRIQLFKQEKVVSEFFDYVIFSLASINK